MDTRSWMQPDWQRFMMAVSKRPRKPTLSLAVSSPPVRKTCTASRNSSRLRAIQESLLRTPLQSGCSKRFTIQPGQWEGIHRHPPDQLYIHIKVGEWTVKYGDGATTSYSPTGEIGWDDSATELNELHESGNTGDEPIDLVWVTLKPGCTDGN